MSDRPLKERFVLRSDSASGHPCCFDASIFLEVVGADGAVLKDYLFAEVVDWGYGERIVAALNAGAKP